MNKQDAVLLLDTYKKEANEYTEEYSFLLPVIEFLLTGDAVLPEIPEPEPEPEPLLTPPAMVIRGNLIDPGGVIPATILDHRKKMIAAEIAAIGRKYAKQYPNYMPDQIYHDMQAEIITFVLEQIDKLCQQ